MRFVAAVALATLGFAQTPSDAQKQGRVSGHVLSQNGEPVRKATVKLQVGNLPVALAALQGASSTYSKTTDDAGAFVFDNVAPGTYTLSSEKTGFLPQRYGARSETSPGTPLVLAAGAEMKDLVVKMTPQAVITGRVIDQEGDPVANAQVTAYQYGYSNGRRQLMPAGANTGAALGALFGGGGGGPGTSDDQGNYRIVNLAPGHYYVSVDPRANRGLLAMIQAQAAGRGGAPKPSVPEPSNITTFYPNSTDAQGAVALDVVGGSEIRGIDIRVRKERVYSIRGKVVDTASGGPAAGAAIMLLPPDANDGNALAMLSNMSSTGPDGNFEIRDLLPGRYTIQGLSVVGPGGLTANGAAGRGAAAPAAPLQMMQPRATNRIEIGISDSDVTDAVLQLSSGTELSGTVKLEEGNLKDILQPGQTNRRILLTVSSGVNLTAPNGQFADDGTFSITNVYPAKYYLTVAGLPQGTYVKSIKLGGQDATKTPLDLTDGGGPLQIVLSSKAADITGTVHNEKGEPVQGVPVTLWPKVADHSSPNGGIRNANTDQNGTFKMAGLAPGDYFVAAWDDIPEAGMNQNPEFLTRFSSDDYAIKLSESSHQNADVKLITRDRIVAEAAKIP